MVNWYYFMITVVICDTIPSFVSVLYLDHCGLMRDVLHILSCCIQWSSSSSLLSSSLVLFCIVEDDKFTNVRVEASIISLQIYFCFLNFQVSLIAVRIYFCQQLKVDCVVALSTNTTLVRFIFALCENELYTCTSGVKKVCSLTQFTMTYAHHS